MFTWFCSLNVVFIIAVSSTPLVQQLKNPEQLKNNRDGPCTTINTNAQDIVFLLDESGSVSSIDYQIALRSLANMTRSFNVGNGVNDTHFALVLFDDQSRVWFNLQNFSTNDDVYNAIMSASYRGGGTNIGWAMTTALGQVFVAPGSRPSAQKSMIIITDGQDTSDTATPAALAKSRNITIYAMGIGNDVDRDQLDSIVGDPTKVYYLSEYELLGEALSQIACPADPINDQHECACNASNMWLDISIVYQTSSIMSTQAKLEIAGPLMSAFTPTTVSQTLPKSIRVAVNTFMASDIITDLSTYADASTLTERFLDIAFIVPNGTVDNTIYAISEGIAVFNRSGRRTNFRKVLVLVLASLSGGQDDIQGMIAGHKANYGILIVVHYVPVGFAPMPGICALASPGMCIIMAANSRTLRTDAVQSITNSLCAANCFCERNDYQYISGDASSPLEHGQCFRVVGAPTTWDFAQRICKLQNSLLTQVFDQPKMNFLTDLSLRVLNTDETFVGLKYLSTMTPPDWYWETRNGFSRISSPADTLWGTANPNRTLGDCVQTIKEGGFQLKLISTNCLGVDRKYTCQYDACDTDNFCPNALGAGETEQMHLRPGQYKPLS